MPNTNISARFSLAPLYTVLLILIAGQVFVTPQSDAQDVADEQSIDAGDEFWFSARSGKEEESAIVVVDDKTRDSRAVIKVRKLSRPLANLMSITRCTTFTNSAVEYREEVR